MPTYELAPCNACGARESHLVADADMLKAELEALWEFHMARLVAGAPPQHLADRLAFSQPLAWRLVQCDACGLVYRNPTERAHEVQDIYAGETPAADVLATLHETQRGAYAAQARRLTAVVGRAGSVIEVGSFVGGFLAAAQAQRWQATGVDVNPSVNAWVRSRGHRVVNGELHDLDLAPVDVVAFWNCFDQLADPAGALRTAHARVRDAGWIVLRVPNGAFYTAHRAQANGLTQRALAWNNLLAFPYRFGFTPGSLRHALERAGFRIERIVGDTLVPVSDRWTRRWARTEERLVKGIQRGAARVAPGRAPWIEVYARKAP